MKRMMTALTCAAAVAFSMAAPAHAESTGSAEYRLEVHGAVEQHGDTSKSRARSVTLECGPAGGNHPKAEEACDLIAEHGDISSVRAAVDGFCTMEYRPVTVRVSGAEKYEETFGNHCVMLNTKGAIFDF